MYLGFLVYILSNPGPGDYEFIQSTKSDGKYFFSKFKSSGATIINP